MEADLLLELTYTGLQFCDESLLSTIEGNLSMAKKDISLEAEEAKKKADAKKSKPEDKKDETLAAPEDEKSKDEETKDKKEEKKSSELKSEKSKSEETGKEEGKDKSEKKSEKPSESKEELKSEKDKKETSKEKSEEKITKVDVDELTKTVKELSESLKSAISGYDELKEKFEKLEAQPASRKTIEIKKGIGDEEVSDKDAEELTKERDKKIEEAKGKYKNDQGLFARIQRIRAEYSEKARQL